MSSDKEGPKNLQDLIFNMSQEFKAHEAKDYIGRCYICNQNLTRNELRYEKGRGFHTDCFEKNKASIVTPNPDVASEGSRLKVQLTLLKNLQVRNTPSMQSKTVKKKTTKKKKSKPKKKRAGSSKTKRKKNGKSKKRFTKGKKVSKRKLKRKPTKKKSSKRRKRI